MSPLTGRQVVPSGLSCAAPLTCPVCDRAGVETDRCPNCDADLHDVRILEQLTPFELQESVLPGPRSPGKRSWLVGAAALGAVGVGIGFMLPHGPFQAPEPSPTPRATATPQLPPQHVDGFRYHVRPGDSLWLIAKRLYGNGDLYPLLRREGTGKMLQPGDIVLVPNRR